MVKNSGTSISNNAGHQQQVFSGWPRPSSYTGVAWVFGMHDRAWFERQIFGKIRYMAASGLERKCDIRGYVKRVDSLAKKA